MPTLVGKQQQQQQRGRGRSTTTNKKTTTTTTSKNKNQTVLQSTTITEPTSTPTSHNNNNNNNQVSFTLSVNGVHFCLQSSNNGSSSNDVDWQAASSLIDNVQQQSDGNVVLSLKNFTGSLVVSPNDNLLSLLATGGGGVSVGDVAVATTTDVTTTTTTTTATVEEEPHSPEMIKPATGGEGDGDDHLSGSGGSNKGGKGTTAKVSPGQQTLSFFAVKKTKKNSTTTSTDNTNVVLTTPVTKNTMMTTLDRKRRKDEEAEDDTTTSTTTTTTTSTITQGTNTGSASKKKSRREFFTLPTKTTKAAATAATTTQAEEDKVVPQMDMDIDPNLEDMDMENNSIVQDIPVFQNTQSTQDDDNNDDDDDVVGMPTMTTTTTTTTTAVDDIDVSQTMDCSSSSSGDDPVEKSTGAITTMKSVVNTDNDDNADDDVESVATARGDEVVGGDLALENVDNDDVDNMKLKDDIDGVAMDADTTTTTTTVATTDAPDTSLIGYPPPPARWGHTMTKIQNDRILVYGGQSFNLNGEPIILSDVHIYSPKNETWQKPINCRGESRQWHTATYIPDRQMIIAFGGETEETTTTAGGGGKKKTRGPITKVKTSETLRVLDTDIMLWYPPAVSGDVPSGRSGHSATYIPETDELLLFGGVRASKWLNAVSILDVRTWVWSSPKVEGSPPKPRSYHSATLVGSNKVVFFGGNNNRQSFNTVHVLELVSAQSNKNNDDADDKKSDSSPSTVGAASGNDSSRSESSGGCTWRWSNPTVTGRAPFPRTGHSATLLQDGKTICMYGGWDPNSDVSDADGGDDNIFKGSYLLDTQTWTWKEGPKVVPGGSGSPHHELEDCGPKRAGHTSVLNGDEVLCFGGRIPGEILAGDIQRLSSP